MYDKFLKLLENQGVSAYKVSQATGISQQTFTDWKAGRYTPKQEKIQKIADYFNVPVSYFYGEEEEPKYYFDIVEIPTIVEIINPFLTPRKKGCVFQHPSVRGIRYASREDF